MKEILIHTLFTVLVIVCYWIASLFNPVIFNDWYWYPLAFSAIIVGNLVLRKDLNDSDRNKEYIKKIEERMRKGGLL